MPIDKDWAKKLAEILLLSRGSITQARIASISGVSDRTISQIETRRLSKPPRKKTIIRLALATNGDTKEWLALVGETCSEDELELCHKIIASGRDDFDADSLRRELMNYIDARLDALSSRIRALERRS